MKDNLTYYIDSNSLLFKPTISFNSLRNLKELFNIEIQIKSYLKCCRLKVNSLLFLF